MNKTHDKKYAALQLRKKGYLYSQIAAELGVSQSTAAVWTKTTPLTSYQMQLLKYQQKTSRNNKIRNLAIINIGKRVERERLLRLEAKKIVNLVVTNTVNKKLICALLFWCEGGKDTRGGMKFINSDPIMVKMYLKFLRQSFSIDESKLRIMLHLHSYHNREQQLIYWSAITSIPIEQFYQPYIKPNGGKNKRVNYAGCVSVRYLDTSLGKLLKMIYTEFGIYIGV